MVEVPTFLVAGHETTRFELKHNYFFKIVELYSQIALRRPGHSLR